MLNGPLNGTVEKNITGHQPMSTAQRSLLPLDSSYRCWAEIDLGSLERNIKRIRAALPEGIKYMAVVKADAYGHGMAQTVSRLMRSGADMFAVANMTEAAEILEMGSGWPILLLSSILPDEDRFLVDYNVIATVSTAGEAERFSRVGKVAGKSIPVHLKIDTGMGRLGVWHEEAPALYKKIIKNPHLKLDGIFTHFSSADSDQKFTDHQRTLFLKALDKLSGLDRSKMLIHADNSAALESFMPESSFNAVRIGLLQFGVHPYKQSFLAKVTVEPVLSFHSRVGLVRTLPAGTGISYGRTHVLKKKSRVAVITAGYGDGLPVSASNKGRVLVRGRKCPILGRVTMDQAIIDVTTIPEIQAGEQVTFIGKQEGANIDVTEFCQWAGQISWEVFCTITKRVPRIYRTDSAD